MTRNQKIFGVLVLGAALLSTTPAHANVIVPLVCAGWFGMALLLIPIMIIEGFVLMFAGIGGGECLRYSVAGNLVSTLAGLPLAICCDGVIHSKTSLYDMSASPEAIKNEPSMWWFLVWFFLLLVPFCLLSWLIEALVITNMTYTSTSWEVISAVGIANLVTYGLFGLIVGGLVSGDLIFNGEKHIEWEQAHQIQRDIVARSLAPTELSTFELANKFASKGMAELRRAEIRIEGTAEVSKIPDPAKVSNQPTGDDGVRPDISSESDSMAA